MSRYSRGGRSRPSTKADWVVVGCLVVIVFVIAVVIVGAILIFR